MSSPKCWSQKIAHSSLVKPFTKVGKGDLARSSSGPGKFVIAHCVVVGILDRTSGLEKPPDLTGMATMGAKRSESRMPTICTGKSGRRAAVDCASRLGEPGRSSPKRRPP